MLASLQVEGHYFDKLSPSWGEGGDNSEVVLNGPVGVWATTSTDMHTLALHGPYRQRLYVQVLGTWLLTGLFASPLLLAW